jgi:hypothetical protein
MIDTLSLCQAIQMELLNLVSTVHSHLLIASVSKLLEN